MATRQYTIAIVDDDPNFRTALSRLLGAIGHRPVLFSSAGDFLSAAATTEATCLLLDINLGDTSGLDLARQLSDAGFNYPLIFMTCSDDDTVRNLCMDFGCVAFLRKPFHEEQLIEAIAKANGISRL